MRGKARRETDRFLVEFADSRTTVVADRSICVKEAERGEKRKLPVSKEQIRSGRIRANPCCCSSAASYNPSRSPS
jgi:hypothetical protein